MRSDAATLFHPVSSVAAVRGEQKEIPMKHPKIASTLVAVGLGLAVAGCGNRPGERAVSGGLLGAGAGAAIGAIAGGSPLTGALIGGTAGAVGGAVTSPRDVNLGRPAWR